MKFVRNVGFIILFFILLSVVVPFSYGKGRKDASNLPELTVESDRNRILHVLAFVRDYSTFATYTDTVFLFREKLVDYMLVPNSGIKFTEWRRPRTLLSQSYYRFTNSQGLDSVSDENPFHFSWSDWMEMPPLEKLPEKLAFHSHGEDTLRGKYSDCIIWKKDGERVQVDVNVLADREGRRWCPSFAGFFNEGLDFGQFKISFSYDNVLSRDLSAADLTRYTYHIESNGRGHERQRMPTNFGPIYITSIGEVYMLDRELITKKEANRWIGRQYDDENVGLFEPADAPALAPEILALIERVERVDKGGVRLSMPPDERLVSLYYGKSLNNVGERALAILKSITGITAYKSRKHEKEIWRKFHREQMERNRRRK